MQIYMYQVNNKIKQWAILPDIKDDVLFPVNFGLDGEMPVEVLLTDARGDIWVSK